MALCLWERSRGRFRGRTDPGQGFAPDPMEARCRPDWERTMEGSGDPECLVSGAVTSPWSVWRVGGRRVGRRRNSTGPGPNPAPISCARRRGGSRRRRPWWGDSISSWRTLCFRGTVWGVPRLGCHEPENRSWVIHRFHGFHRWTGTRGRTASLFPCHLQGETTTSLNRLPIFGIGPVCGSNRHFQEDGPCC